MLRRTLAKLSLEPQHFSINTGERATAVKVEFERDITVLQDRFRQWSTNALIDENTYSPSMIQSKDIEAARFHTRAFYRKVIRMVPKLLVGYNLVHIPPYEAVRSIKILFRKNATNSAQVMDVNRWRGEIMFTDIVRMHFTTSHVHNLLYHFRPLETLPSLPAAALPPNTDEDVMDITANGSDFLQEFLDPQEAARKRVERELPTPTLI